MKFLAWIGTPAPIDSSMESRERSFTRTVITSPPQNQLPKPFGQQATDRSAFLSRHGLQLFEQLDVNL